MSNLTQRLILTAASLLGLAACSSDPAASPVATGTTTAQPSAASTTPAAASGAAGSPAASTPRGNQSPAGATPVGTGAAGTAPAAASSNGSEVENLPKEGAAAPAAGHAAPGSTTDEWPSDCEEHYKVRVFKCSSTSSCSGSQSDESKYTVPAGQQIHPQFTFEAPWGNTEVQAVRFKAITDNTRVLHHWILNGPPINSSSGAGANKFIAGWAPGNEGDKLPPDVGMYLPSGNLRLDLHYYNTGNDKAEDDKSGVEICVIKNKANFRKNTAAVIGLTGNATAPAHMEVDNSTTCTAQVKNGSVYLLGVSPHMHKLGVHAKLGLQAGGGMMNWLHDAPFEFDEQAVWPLNNVEVKNGDKLTTVCSYKNDTNTSVRFGPNTEDEMCFNFTTYYPMGNLTCGQAL